MDVNRDYAGGLGITIGHNTRTSYGHEECAFPNLELAMTAGVLEGAGYDTEFLDAQAEQLDSVLLIEHISNSRVQFLVCLLNLPSIAGDLQLLSIIKQACQDLVIIGIGSVCKMIPDNILNSDSLDYLVIGEPEVQVKEIIDHLVKGESVNDIRGVAFRRDRETIQTPATETLVDLRSLPGIPYGLLPVSKYTSHMFGAEERLMPLISSRGCPFKCAYYCPYPMTAGKKIRFRDPQKVVDEIEYLYREFGVRRFVFRDQNFTFSSKHVREICRSLAKSNLDIEWVCETRFDLIKSASLLADMRQAGCRQINFGLESGDPELFEGFAKPMASFDQIERALTLVKQAKIRTHVHLIVGLLGESWKTIRNTSRILQQYDIDSIQLSNMIAYPGTEFHLEAKKKGLIMTNNLARYGGSHIVVRTEKLSRLELALARYYLRRRLVGLKYSEEIGRLLARLSSALLNVMQARMGFNKGNVPVRFDG